MSILYVEAEDQIIRNGVRSGISDRDIRQCLADAGFPRTLSSIQSRRIKLGIYRVRELRSMAAGLEIEGPVADHRIDDAAFCAAIRAAHPDIKDGFAATEPSRSVPLRSLPRPLFSSTGVMS